MLSEEDKRTILERRMKFESCASIALDYGVAGMTISRLSRHLNLPRTKPGPKADQKAIQARDLNAKGLPRKVIVARVGCSYSFLRTILGPKHKRRWQKRPVEESHNNNQISD